MDEEIKGLIDIFECANERFLNRNSSLFESRVSERTLCGALMLELHEVLKNTKYADYYTDVEYNRRAGKLKTIRKTMYGPKEEIVPINCDLIVHSRGEKTNDNLIALEMKKSNTSRRARESDRIRLECLTKAPYGEVYSADGKALPEYVCGYKLGIYYEINYNRRQIRIEYYADGYAISKPDPISF